MALKIKILASLLIIWLLLLVANALGAEIPPYISYQGYLTDDAGNPVPNDIFSVYFRLYDAHESGNEVWASAGYVSVETNGGYFTHLLGATNPLPDSMAEFLNLWLGMTIDPGTELAPRTRLVSVGFAFKSLENDYAQNADSSIYADSALFSVYSNHSLTSEESIFANIADTVIYTDTAGYSNQAGHSVMADNATQAYSADSSVFADSVAYSNLSDHSISAAFATHAQYADSATIAWMVAHAGHANEARYAFWGPITNRLDGLYETAFADTGHTHFRSDIGGLFSIGTDLDNAFETIRTLKEKIAWLEKRLSDLEQNKR
jgi:hypothetical protein